VPLAIMMLVMALNGAGHASEAESQFATGKSLIEANDPEAYGSTIEGLENGVHAVEKALALGYPHKAAAYRLLGFAYTNLGVDSRVSEAAHEGNLRKARAAFEEYFRLVPNDVEARYRYATTYRDPTARLRVYRDLLAIDPNHAQSLYAAGYILLRDLPEERRVGQPPTVSQRETEEGVRYLKRAAQLLPGYDAYLAIRIPRLLKDHGRKKDAEDVEKVLEKRGIKRPQ